MNGMPNDFTKPRVRFAPSPTGALHIGGLRTALYNFLFARHEAGAFLLRIEDTDQKRLVPGSEEGIITTLNRFGLTPDEPPIRQSERLELYRAAADELVQSGLAYTCFCSTERLTQLRAKQEQAKQQPRYDGLCRALEPSVANARLHEPHVIRFAIPPGSTTTQDIIHGASNVHNETQDDLVIIKSDGFPTYHLASVVDDHDMKITHVIRGDEWLPSLAKHILLYQAFGWTPPQFVHLPLLLSASKKKLSKREADVSVESYLQQGYLEPALLNFISLLGWNPTADREKYALQELIALFDITAINKSGAVVNFEKLRWLNREYLKELSAQEYLERARPFYESAVAALDQPAAVDADKVLTIMRERVHVFSDIVPAEINFLCHPTIPDPAVLVWRKSNPTETVEYLTALINWIEHEAPEVLSSASRIEESMLSWIQERAYPMGSILWPLRFALSGQPASPPPFILLWLFGKEESIRRIKHAIERLATYTPVA